MIVCRISPETSRWENQYVGSGSWFGLKVSWFQLYLCWSVLWIHERLLTGACRFITTRITSIYLSRQKYFIMRGKVCPIWQRRMMLFFSGLLNIQWWCCIQATKQHFSVSQLVVSFTKDPSISFVKKETNLQFYFFLFLFVYSCSALQWVIRWRKLHILLLHSCIFGQVFVVPENNKKLLFFKWKQCNTLCIKIPNPGTQITQPERTRGCNKTATLSWWAVQNRSSSCQTWTPNSEALLWLWPAALVMSHLGRIVQRALLHPHRHYLLSSLLASSQTAKHSLSVQKTPS